MSTITDTIFMVRPYAFGYNPITAENNAFQSKGEESEAETISQEALAEFDAFVTKLRENGIQVIVFNDSELPIKKDAVFPNNWISLHENGVLVTYPMFAENRRAERNEDFINELKERFGYEKRYFFEHYEAEQKFLEGTGSMILDRDNRNVYACLSERTSVEILEKFSVLMNYRKVFFHATDSNNNPIYHTNVMMAIGEELCILCKETIRDETELNELLHTLESSGKQVIEISIQQMEKFAGNMLELKNKSGNRFLVMSEQAYLSLEPKQIEAIEQHDTILHAPLYTIEKYGGGSARCMITEIFV